ncbi:hypothetical protein ACS0TY_014512 [Phlomoides rotata]
MENIEDIDAQLHLPEAIIQLIQSFLTRKEAASTVVLSKPWYKAWLTRPVLDFDEHDFPNVVQFLNFATTSMERYHESNLNIDTFKLWMDADDSYSFSRAIELIVNALKIGAVDFNVELDLPFSFPLPKEVFESKPLVELSVNGCIISDVDVICSRLKSLSLLMVHIEDSMIRRIILNCPRLENLLLYNCNGIDEVNVGRMVNIKNLCYYQGVTTTMRGKIPLIRFEENGSTAEFCRLTSLLLERVKIDEMLFSDFSSKFPCVKNLKVHHCLGCVNFDISSHSINSISLAHMMRLKIRLDVPNIHKFKFSGATNIPLLYVVPAASMEWESNIALSCWNNLRVWWFLELNDFLTNLCTSKITLGIELMRVRDAECLPEFAGNFKPMVENLTLQVNSLLSDGGVALADGLCWSFRPKFINLHLNNTKDRRSHTITELQKQSNEFVLILSKKLMYPVRLQDLEQANIEILEDEQWRPLDPITFHNDVARMEKDVHIRFQLSWRQH